MQILTNLHIWDGHEVLSANTICIDGDLITDILHSDDLSGQQKQVIDCGGLTAIPGLIDAHVHLELNPDDRQPPQRTEPSVIPLMAERAHNMAMHGITTARDLGGGAWFELALRDQIAKGELTGPRLLCAGQPITCPQGHCHFWGGEASTLAEALQVLTRQVEQGVDLIKVMATGGRMTKGSSPQDAQFSQADLSEIVAAAHAKTLPVAAHCHGTEGIRRAAHAGVDTIEHCSFVGPEGWASDYQAEVADVIANNDIWVSPTVNKGWQRMLDSKTGEVLSRVRYAYQEMLKKNIPMVASTDAGIPGVYHHELAPALLVFAKIAQLDNNQALRSATSDAARALRIQHITGALKPGLAADILLLDGNPLEDLSAITRLAQVFVRGQAVRD